MIIDIR